MSASEALDALDAQAARRAAWLAAWHDTGIDAQDPAAPSPWDADERRRFGEAAQAFLAGVRGALGPQVEIVDESGTALPPVRQYGSPEPVLAQPAQPHPLPQPTPPSQASQASPPEPSSPFATLPDPPYYAVVFSSRRRANPGAARTDGDEHGDDDDDDGYGAMAERMVALAAAQPGFLGVESVRGADGFGITVSYWASLAAIAAWKAHAEHRVAQQRGRDRWYARYALRVARVERAWGHRADAAAGPAA